MKYPRKAYSQKTRLRNNLAAVFIGTIVLNFQTVSNAQENLAPQQKANSLKIAAFGDSITRAFNANTLGDHPGNSWATGHSNGGGIFNPGSVKSHAEFLKEKTSRQVDVLNAAKTGATSQDLNRQIDSVAGTQLDYATVLIGANDLCGYGASFNVSDFSDKVENSIQKLIERNPQIKILIVGIPDLIRLQQIGTGTSCQSKWNTLGICKSLLKSGVTQSEIEDFRTRWRSANEELAMISAKYSEHVYFNTRVSEFQFERDHLSDLDCFHPNIKGQNLLSREAWIGGWWDQ